MICVLKSYCDLERSSMHNDLFSDIEVLHCVEEVIIWSRLGNTVSTNECAYKEISYVLQH